MVRHLLVAAASLLTLGPASAQTADDLNRVEMRRHGVAMPQTREVRTLAKKTPLRIGASANCGQFGGYPFVQNGCLNAAALNGAIDVSWGALPPQNNLGQGALIGHFWSDTSTGASTPTLRQCVTLAGCSATYNAAEWLNWGAYNIATQTLVLGGSVTVTSPNLTGPITSVGNVTSIASKTGTGTKFVVDTNPTLVGPTLGAALATSVNGNFLTSGPWTLTGASGKTLTFNNNLTLNGVDGKTLTLNNTLVLAGTDGATLNIGGGGGLGSNAYTSTAFAPLASPALTNPTIGGGSAITSSGPGGTMASGAYTTVGTAAVQNYIASSWSPAITTDSVVGTPAYTIQIGTYEQIGRQVTVRWLIQLSGWTGSPTGSVLISGLPVAVANVTNDNGKCWINDYVIASGGPGLSGTIAFNTTSIIIRTWSSTSSLAQLTAAQLGPTGLLAGACSYRV